MHASASAVAITFAATALALSGCGGEPAGDAAAGKEIYRVSGCASCHTFSKFEGRGRNGGPNLDEVAKRYDAEFIRESLTNPSAFLEKGGGGEIGGSRTYGNTMPAYGPEQREPGHLTEQELADLVAFVDGENGEN